MHYKTADVLPYELRVFTYKLVTLMSCLETNNQYVLINCTADVITRERFDNIPGNPHFSTQKLSSRITQNIPKHLN